MILLSFYPKEVRNYSKQKSFKLNIKYMNYEKLAAEINETLNFRLTEVNMNNLIGVVQREHEWNVFRGVHGEELNVNKFEELARPMIKYLCENYHPHVTVIITPTGAELLEGLKATGRIEDYIRD